MRFKTYCIFAAVALIVTLLQSPACCAQQDSIVRRKSFSNIIKTNPLSTIQGPVFLLGEQRILYERKLRGKKSIELGASYLAANSLIEEELLAAAYTLFHFVMYTGFFPKNISFSSAPSPDHPVLNPLNTGGYRLQASYRYYPFSHEMKGFYTSFRVSDCDVSGSVLFDGKIPFRVNMFNTTCNIGVQLINKKGFTFDAYTGLGYRRIVSRYGTDPLNTINGVKFCLGLNAGVAF